MKTSTNPCVSSVLFSVLLCLCGWRCTCVRHSNQEQRFRTGIDLVTVDVVVLDGKGEPVQGLTRADFTVLEDGKAAADSRVSVRRAARLRAGADGAFADGARAASPSRTRSARRLDEQHGRRPHRRPRLRPGLRRREPDAAAERGSARGDPEVSRHVGVQRRRRVARHHQRRRAVPRADRRRSPPADGPARRRRGQVRRRHLRRAHDRLRGHAHPHLPGHARRGARAPALRVLPRRAASSR